MNRSFLTGINIVERSLLRTKFEDCDQIISIVELLRQLRTNQTPPTKVKIVGLEDLLTVLQSKESIRLFRRTISDSADRLSQRGIVLIVPVSKIVMNTGPSIQLDDQHIPLAPVFGNRLQPRDHPGYFHAPFNIS